MKELAKQYNPEEVEDRIYEKWLKGNAFAAKVNPNKKPFTIMMPPPNVTGQLHMGHALDNAGLCGLVAAETGPCSHCHRGKGYQ